MGKFFKGKARKKRTPAYSVSVGNGAMWVDFFVDEKDARGCYLTVKDCHGTFEHRVTGYTYGYLLTAVRKGRESEVEAYAYMIWMVSNDVYKSLGFCGDIVSACNRYADGKYGTGNAEEGEEQRARRDDADRAGGSDTETTQDSEGTAPDARTVRPYQEDDKQTENTDEGSAD